MPLPTRNAAYTYRLGLVARSGGQLQVDPTIEAGDFQLSIDGGAFANLTTLPSVEPAGGRVVVLSLTSAEMDGDVIVVQGVDQNGEEWNDFLAIIETRLLTDTDLLIPARYAYNYTEIETISDSQKRVRIYGDDDTDGSGSPIYEFNIDYTDTTETRHRGD